MIDSRWQHFCLDAFVPRCISIDAPFDNVFARSVPIAIDSRNLLIAQSYPLILALRLCTARVLTHQNRSALLLRRTITAQHTRISAQEASDQVAFEKTVLRLGAYARRATKVRCLSYRTRTATMQMPQYRRKICGMDSIRGSLTSKTYRSRAPPHRPS